MSPLGWEGHVVSKFRVAGLKKLVNHSARLKLKTGSSPSIPKLKLNVLVAL